MSFLLFFAHLGTQTFCLRESLASPTLSKSDSLAWSHGSCIFFLSLAPSQFHINALTLSDSILPFFPFPPSPSCPLSSSLDTSPSLTLHGQGSKKDSGRTITFTEDTACLQFSDDAVADVAIQTTPLALTFLCILSLHIWAVKAMGKVIYRAGSRISVSVLCLGLLLYCSSSTYSLDCVWIGVLLATNMGEISSSNMPLQDDRWSCSIRVLDADTFMSNFIFTD